MARSATVALVVGIAGLAASVAGFFVDRGQFFHSWLIGFAFWTTLALGMLFFTMLHHLTGAVWSVVLRRITETGGMMLPILALFFVPLLFGMHDLYHWSHKEAVASDKLLQWKAGYLNVPFFIVRGAVVFAIWTLLAYFLNKHSLAQDAGGDPARARSMKKISAGGMFLFAFSVTFAAFDWLMSLNPHWYSTMFGVYIFTGGFLVSLAFLTLFALWMRRRGDLVDTIRVDHYHDLGRMLFAFTVFWAYIGGSQYFLVWYANIPEETVWFLARWEGGWKSVSLALIVLHFAVPFLVLAFYATKRNLAVLGTMAGLLLAMHFVDIVWLILPNLHRQFSVSWLDFAPLAGIGGVLLWRFFTRYAAHPAVPIGDPKLTDSIEHRV
jgi:hypothetical protein